MEIEYGRVWFSLMGSYSALKLVFTCLTFSLILGFHSIEGKMRESTSIEGNAKTIKTKYGEEYNCVDLYRQPAFKHSLLKDHKIQMRPNNFAGQRVNAANAQKNESRIHIGCPLGTVPIRRTTKEESFRAKAMFRDQFPASYAVNGITPRGFMFAGIGTKFRAGIVYHGAGGFISIWNPTVSPGQFSATAISIEGGPPEQFSVIRVGWMVNPSLFHDNHTHLYTIWGQGVNGVMHGCYNTYCPGFIHTDRTIALEMILKPVSVLRGNQYYVELSVSQDKFTGNWWLIYNEDTPLGYWPSNLFSNLNDGADALKWGGMVYSSTPQVPTMGNGDNGKYHSCHFRQVELKYEAGSSLNGTIDAPIGVIKTKCYKAGDNSYKGDFWGYSFYLGGNGGDVSQCSKSN